MEPPNLYFLKRRDGGVAELPDWDQQPVSETVFSILLVVCLTESKPVELATAYDIPVWSIRRSLPNKRGDTSVRRSNNWKRRHPDRSDARRRGNWRWETGFPKSYSLSRVLPHQVSALSRILIPSRRSAYVIETFQLLC